MPIDVLSRRPLDRANELSTDTNINLQWDVRDTGESGPERFVVTNRAQPRVTGKASTRSVALSRAEQAALAEMREGTFWTFEEKQA